MKLGESERDAKAGIIEEGQDEKPAIYTGGSLSVLPLLISSPACIFTAVFQNYSGISATESGMK